MIIWLASYPRSGNTLLRTILVRCFGLGSYSEEPVRYNSEFRKRKELIGHIEMGERWSDFYNRASESSEIFLVKTHLPPKDNQPFIYVVRDGRRAIRSYRKFHKDYNKIDKTIAELILGLDAYGDWSSHFFLWNGRAVKKKILLRFEELTNISRHTLHNIAELLEYEDNISEWVNPLNKLKEYEPNFFNTHLEGIEEDEEWTTWIEYLFNKIHGELMYSLQYYNDSCRIGYNRIPVDADCLVGDFIRIIKELQKNNAFLLETCEERMELIDSLQRTCEERMQLINELQRICEESG